MNKQEIVRLALNNFNNGSYPFEVAFEEGKLVARWRWKDATIFGTQSVSKEISEFKYVVTIKDDGTFYGRDESSAVVAKASSNNTISIGKSAFVGQQTGMHKEISFGKKKDEAGFGLQHFNFSTDDIHEPIKNFLEECGLKYKKKHFLFG